mmetsp:Transcript_12742/g.20625  ORF Transcript_12742/g.20625 Transcript_12742/m.20625 type:complete len:588 (+) Transcript_12742:49-1812(+)
MSSFPLSRGSIWHRTFLILLIYGALPIARSLQEACNNAETCEDAEISGASGALMMIQLGLHASSPLQADRSRGVVSAFGCVWTLLAVIAISYYVFVTFLHSEDNLSPGAEALAKDHAPVKRRSSSGERTPIAKPSTGRGPLTRRATITVAEIVKTVKTWSAEDAIGTLSGGGFVLTICCDIGPNGIVPLPHGLVSTGLIPGMLLTFGFYALCTCTMWMIARTSFITGKLSFAEQWAQLIGEQSSWIPVAVLIAVCFGNCIEYLCFVADLLAGALPAFGLPITRNLSAWLFALFPTLPLCFLKDLSALAPTSLLGLLSVIYLVLVICYRKFDGSYLPGGHFFADLPVDSQPSVPHDHLFQFGLPSLVLVNALLMGFLPHYNGCKYYRELENHNPSRFFTFTALGMGAAVCLYAIAMLVGYQTFGSPTQSVITESYSSNDMLINVARLCIGFSILFSFPIMFSGLREAILQLLTDFAHVECEQVWKQDVITVVMVVVIAFLTSILTDVGLVVGLVGPICGIAAIFLMPCTLYAAALKWRVSSLVDSSTSDFHSDAYDKNMYAQIFLARSLSVLGVFLMIGGVYATFAYP